MVPPPVHGYSVWRTRPISWQVLRDRVRRTRGQTEKGQAITQFRRPVVLVAAEVFKSPERIVRMVEDEIAAARTAWEADPSSRRPRFVSVEALLEQNEVQFP